MMRRILMMTLLVYAITLACAVNAQVTDVDVTAAQTLRPIVVTDSGDPKNLLALRRKYSIMESSRDYGFDAGEDPNPIYKRARPFPETGLVSLLPFSPFGGDSTHASVQRVQAWRLHWPWPPPNLKSVPESETQTLWRWDVPKQLQKSWWTEAGGGGLDRYWALCLYSGVTPTANRPAEPAEPQLFYFDTLSGLRWQATIPLSQTLDSVRTPGAPRAYAGDAETLLGITADGSRVLALVSRPDKKASLLFVFDGKGKLLRTLRLSGYAVTLQNGMNPWQLQRSPSGQTFLIRLRHHFEGASDESCLVDSEGSLLARFVNDEGQPVTAFLLSEKYVAARMQRPDGEYWQYIYELPVQK